MQIKKIMTTGVAACRADTNLAVVTKLMWDHDCGFVPVVDAAGTVIGVLTDRDVCIASATRRLLPEQISAAETMTKAVHVCSIDDTVADALNMMKHGRVRRLPVVAADGTLRGIVSVNDIVLAARQKGGPTATSILSALAAICEHSPKAAAAA